MRKHLLYYISLITLLIVGFSMAKYFSHDPSLQMACVVLVAFLYVVWGVLHHVLHHSFSIRVMLEYVAVGVLGISIVFFVLRIGL